MSTNRTTGINSEWRLSQYQGSDVPKWLGNAGDSTNSYNRDMAVIAAGLDLLRSEKANKSTSTNPLNIQPVALGNETTRIFGTVTNGNYLAAPLNHRHNLPVAQASPKAMGPGSVTDLGSNSSVARADHRHSFSAWGRTETAIPRGNHSHGFIDLAGRLHTSPGENNQIESTRAKNRPLISNDNGTVVAGSFGTGALQFAAGNHTHGRLRNNGMLNNASGNLVAAGKPVRISTTSAGRLVGADWQGSGGFFGNSHNFARGDHSHPIPKILGTLQGGPGVSDWISSTGTHKLASGVTVTTKARDYWIKSVNSTADFNMTVVVYATVYLYSNPESKTVSGADGTELWWGTVDLSQNTTSRGSTKTASSGSVNNRFATLSPVGFWNVNKGSNIGRIKIRITSDYGCFRVVGGTSLTGVAIAYPR